MVTIVYPDIMTDINSNFFGIAVHVVKSVTSRQNETEYNQTK